MKNLIRFFLVTSVVFSFQFLTCVADVQEERVAVVKDNPITESNSDEKVVENEKSESENKNEDEDIGKEVDSSDGEDEDLDPETFAEFAKMIEEGEKD